MKNNQFPSNMKTFVFKVIYGDDYFIEEVIADCIQSAEKEIETLYMYFGKNYYYRLIKTK